MADRLIRLDASYREFQHNFRTNRIISSFEGNGGEGRGGGRGGSVGSPCTATLAELDESNDDKMDLNYTLHLGAVRLVNLPAKEEIDWVAER